MTFIQPFARIGAMPSNTILWNEEKDLLVADGLIKSPTKEKGKKTKAKKCKSKADEEKKKPMCKRKSQSAQKKGTPREER